MSTARRSQALKAPDDRQRYIQNIPYPKDKLSPTYEEALVEIDTTESAPKDEAPQYTDRYKPAPRESSFIKFFREKWPEMIVLLMGGFLALQIYGLNREIGELKVKNDQHEKDSQRYEEDIRKLEERFQKEIDKLDGKVERLTPNTQSGKR